MCDLAQTGGALRSHENKPGSDQGFRMKGVWKGSRCFFGPKLAVNSVGYLSYVPISSNFGLWLKSSSNSIPCFPRLIRGFTYHHSGYIMISQLMQVITMVMSTKHPNCTPQVSIFKKQQWKISNHSLQAITIYPCISPLAPHSFPGFPPMVPRGPLGSPGSWWARPTQGSPPSSSGSWTV